MFAGNGVTADSEDINDLLRAANGTAADEGVHGLDVSFEAFTAWMQSSSPLADGKSTRNLPLRVAGSALTDCLGFQRCVQLWVACWTTNLTWTRWVSSQAILQPKNCL